MSNMNRKIADMTSDEIVTELAAMIKARCWVGDRRDTLELTYTLKKSQEAISALERKVKLTNQDYIREGVDE